MTNELGTTLQDIEAKAEDKLWALRSLAIIDELTDENYSVLINSIRKYIEEN